MDNSERIVRNQIDYIMINKRYKNCISVKAYLGADIQSDHNPLIGVFRVRLKKLRKYTSDKPNLRKLDDPVIKNEVQNRMNSLCKGQVKNSSQITT